MAIHPNTHPVWLRMTHWINAVAFTVMVMSGWRIYNASPLFESFEFPRGVTLGGWLGGALLWHFAAMWLLVINGTAYLLFGFMTGRLRRKLAVTPAELRNDTVALLHGRLDHSDVSHFNAIQKLAYLIAITALTLIVLSGLVVFKSVQFSLLTQLFGGYDNARLIHFLCMATLVGFLLIHVAAAVFVPKTIVAMIRGY